MKEEHFVKGVDMGVNEILVARRGEILRIARKHGVACVRVFGSVARGDASETSDVDLLIEVQGPTPPWFPGGLVAELEALLGRRVDVVEAEAIREDLRADVLEEAVPL
jgi:predicted nucleotidyltransferase